MKRQEMDVTKRLADYHFRDGKNQNEVAKILGISKRKLKKIFGGKQELDEAEKQKELIEMNLEDAIIKKACGYSYTETKETEKESGTEVVTVTKECLPDITAARTWLESRCGEIWNNKTQKNSSEEKLDFIIAQIDSEMSE